MSEVIDRQEGGAYVGEPFETSIPNTTALELFTLVFGSWPETNETPLDIAKHLFENIQPCLIFRGIRFPLPVEEIRLLISGCEGRAQKVCLRTLLVQESPDSYSLAVYLDPRAKSQENRSQIIPYIKAINANGCCWYCSEIEYNGCNYNDLKKQSPKNTGVFGFQDKIEETLKTNQNLEVLNRLKENFSK